MGRHKTTNKHLPPRMRRKGKSHYHVAFVDGHERWTPLGQDYIAALMKYRDLEGLNEGAATVAQMLDNALAKMDLKPATLREFTRACTRLKVAFQGFLPSDVEPRHIAQYLEARTNKKGHPARVAANREISFFSAAWEIARRRGWINLPNPSAGVQRNKERKRKRTATPTEIQALLFSKDDTRRDCVEADMVELALMTAMREGDLLHFTLHQIEPDGIRIRPRKTADSTEVEQFFRFTPQLRALLARAKLRRRRVGSIYLFPVQRGKRAGQPYSGPSFYKVWRPYFEACGITGLTWHDLRRTALNMRKREAGKEAAQDLGAHSSITTTEGYLAGAGPIILEPVALEFGKTAEIQE